MIYKWSALADVMIDWLVTLKLQQIQSLNSTADCVCVWCFFCSSSQTQGYSPKGSFSPVMVREAVLGQTWQRWTCSVPQSTAHGWLWCRMNEEALGEKLSLLSFVAWVTQLQYIEKLFKDTFKKNKNIFHFKKGAICNKLPHVEFILHQLQLTKVTRVIRCPQFVWVAI